MATLFGSDFDDLFAGWDVVTSAGTITELSGGGRTFARHSATSGGFNNLGLVMTTGIAFGAHTIYWDARFNLAASSTEMGWLFNNTNALTISQSASFGYLKNNAGDMKRFPTSAGTTVTVANDTWYNFKFRFKSGGEKEIFFRADDGQEPWTLDDTDFTDLTEMNNLAGFDPVGENLHFLTNPGMPSGDTMDISRFRYTDNGLPSEAEGSDEVDGMPVGARWVGSGRNRLKIGGR